MEPYALPAQIHAAGLVFLRVGAVVMLLPGLGEAVVPPRIRLAFALLLSMCLAQIALPTLPPMPATVGDLAGQVIKELMIGLVLGALMKVTLSALQVAGEVISMQTTLAFSQTANPMEAQPSSSVGSFLSLMGITLIFATNLHHMFIGAIARSYTLFAPAKHVLVQDAVTVAVSETGAAFGLGVQLAGPVIVFSLVFNIASGLVGRVMPQFQIFFAATPLSLIFGLSLFALSLGAGALTWLDRYQDVLRVFN